MRSLFQCAAVPCHVLASLLEAPAHVTKKRVIVRNAKNRSDEAEDRPVPKVQPASGHGSTAAAAADGNQLSATESHLRQLKQVLRQQCVKNVQQGQLPHMDAIQLLLNPRSFTQTVENLMNLSHLVKKGEAGWIMVDNDDDDNHNTLKQKLGVQVVQQTTGNRPATQAICSFTMADWRRWKVVQGSKPVALEHRGGGGGAHANN